MPHLSQAIDWLAANAREQRLLQREERMRQEGQEREDRQTKATRQIGLLSDMANQPDIDPTSRSEIRKSILGLISAPDSEVSLPEMKEFQVPAPADWKKYGAPDKMTPTDYQRWEAEIKAKRSKEESDAQRRNELERARIMHSDTNKQEKLLYLKERSDILKKYREAAAEVIGAGGIQQFDAEGNVTGIEKVPEQLMVQYIREVDKLLKKASTGQWSKEDDELFMQIDSALGYIRKEMPPDQADGFSFPKPSVEGLQAQPGGQAMNFPMPAMDPVKDEEEKAASVPFYKKMFSTKESRRERFGDKKAGGLKNIPQGPQERKYQGLFAQ